MTAPVGLTVTYVDVEDRKVTISCLDLQQQILALLAFGPLARWELRERLHIPEEVISRQLPQMKLAGQVKSVGRQQLARKWALADWEPDAIEPDPRTVMRGEKPEPATDSWWARPAFKEDRKAFKERAARGTDV